MAEEKEKKEEEKKEEILKPKSPSEIIIPSGQKTKTSNLEDDLDILLTKDEKTDLTDGGNCSSHKHDDRYLYKENTGAFTPDGDYEPATKKYVDDQVNAISKDLLQKTFVAGEDLTAGDAVYLDYTNDKVYKACADYDPSTENDTNVSLRNGLYLGLAASNATAGNDVAVNIIGLMSGMSFATTEIGKTFYLQDADVNNILSQSYTGNALRIDSVNDQIAYIVNLTAGTRIDRVEIRFATAASSGKLKVQIQGVTGPGGEQYPDGNVYIESLEKNFSASPGTTDPTIFELPHPWIVPTSGLYSIVLICTELPSGGAWDWEGEDGAAGSGGPDANGELHACFSSDGGGSWTVYLDKDMQLILSKYVSPGQIGTSAGTVSVKVGKAIDTDKILLLPQI